MNKLKQKERNIKSKRKWGISLRSKYTGEEITLGSSYNSHEEALKGAEEQVCPRCNSFSIISLPEDAIWTGKKRGFVSSSILREENKLKEQEETKKNIEKHGFIVEEVGEIIIEKAVERKEGLLYYIDNEGNVCAAKIKKVEEQSKSETSNELNNILEAIQSWVEKHDGNVQFVGSFVAFKGKNFDVIDDRMLAYGSKTSVRDVLKILDEEVEKDKEDFVNW